MTRFPALLLVLALGGAAGGCPGGFLLPPPPPLLQERVGVVALAGPDLVVLEGARTALAGRASRSFTGDPLLSWSQVEGPSVLLTNPSSSLPAFTAPLAPARLRFELRAEAAGAVATDQVVVDVVTAPALATLGPAGFIDVPGDTVAEPLTTHSFRVEAGGATGAVTLSARVSCGDGAAASVAAVAALEGDVTVVLPATLPCAVILDGLDEAGRALAPAARIFWPAATPLPAATGLSTGINSLVESGGEASLEFAADDTPGSAWRAWSTGGADDVLPGGADGSDVTFIVPRRAGKLVLAGEAVTVDAAGRAGAGPSGGVAYAFIDVSAGSGNIAPVASGGPDRVVQPGGRFRLDSSASFDLDGDLVSITTEQVLGPSAIPDALIGGAFQAPTQAGVLLFHIVADDGRVLSAADPVRVVVDTDAENLPPVLALPATRYVTPGQVFVVDGSGAEDPDSGFIASTTIAQAEDDAVIVLNEPVDDVDVELVAGLAGEVYRFLISAYDEDGLGVTVEQSVIVEEAGPYVDALRGDDGDGNGTAAAPFASVTGALATAVRHALPELLLAEGLQAPIGVVLPPRVSLRGGFAFDASAAEATYLAGPIEGGDAAGATILPVSGEGLGFVDAHAATLTLALNAATGSITLQGSASLEGVHLRDTAAHTAPLLVVFSQAAARISDVEVEAAGAPSPASIVIEAAATVRLVATRVKGAAGNDAVAISCLAATMSLEASNIVGASGAEAGTGVRARDGCALDVTASIISGGEAAAATGIDAQATLLTTDSASTIVGAFGDAASAIAVRFGGRERSALIKSTLLATADVATGLLCDDAQVNLVDAVIEARGALSIAVQPDRCVLASQGAVLAADIAAMRGAQADDVTFAGGSIEGGDAAVDLDGDRARSFRDVVIRSGGIGVRALDAFVELNSVEIAIEGDDDALGVSARGAAIRDSSIAVAGLNARAIVVADRFSTLERTAIHVTRSGSAAISAGAGLALLSSLVTTDNAPGLESGGPVTLRHASVVTGAGAALTLLTGGSLDGANSVLAGSPGIATASADAPWQQAVALAFSSTGPLLTQPAVALTTIEQLDDLGCELCLVLEPSALALLIDGDGHLAAGANPLVDAGDDELSLADDIDGEPRPQGAGVDVGCDERAP